MASDSSRHQHNHRLSLVHPDSAGQVIGPEPVLDLSAQVKMFCLHPIASAAYDPVSGIGCLCSLARRLLHAGVVHPLLQYSVLRQVSLVSLSFPFPGLLCYLCKVCFVSDLIKINDVLSAEGWQERLWAGSLSLFLIPLFSISWSASQRRALTPVVPAGDDIETCAIGRLELLEAARFGRNWVRQAQKSDTFNLYIFLRGVWVQREFPEIAARNVAAFLGRVPGTSTAHAKALELSRIREDELSDSSQVSYASSEGSVTDLWHRLSLHVSNNFSSRQLAAPA
eukprot:CAMPEP_0197635286 /NCGR_PEP_ID=MMETSP1338-20131121/11144_1 /TAXON_ID=43686 ORGANISM="Pelagodinium beii, Strain RCC1491" /NCGR_SAMPLE_ID=MMETSP1338 /ASSEMBLY_ACC=CAM_ASM_000754 /LENGTH=281 /DNA_ID=CAMNT_0043207305 /DNA_START=256 /DNA_END=1102 /DNA_ORIENTATION=-